MFSVHRALNFVLGTKKKKQNLSSFKTWKRVSQYYPWVTAWKLVLQTHLSALCDLESSDISSPEVCTIVEYLFVPSIWLQVFLNWTSQRCTGLQLRSHRKGHTAPHREPTDKSSPLPDRLSQQTHRHLLTHLHLQELTSNCPQTQKAGLERQLTIAAHGDFSQNQSWVDSLKGSGPFC